MKKINLTTFLVCTSLWLFGQSNILRFEESKGSPKAQLSDISWIQGMWRGEALGGITEEIWSAPLGGAIMGSFRVVKDNKVTIYELETIVEQDETLLIRLKHFDGKLNGWEEKNVTVDFKLVKVTPDKVYFDGFTFERINKDAINTYVLINNEEVKFSFQRFEN
jgi:hypothetical protein